MQELIKGVHRFRNDEFGNYRSLFQRLSKEGQNPHTLFITCSDSRVLVELITQSKPGDLFVVKNIGNIVPPSSATGSTNSTAAAIEFAVENLRVRTQVLERCRSRSINQKDHADCAGAEDLPHEREAFLARRAVQPDRRTVFESELAVVECNRGGVFVARCAVRVVDLG